MRPSKLTALASILLLAVSTFASDCVKFCNTFEKHYAEESATVAQSPCHGENKESSSENNSKHQVDPCLGGFCFISEYSKSSEAFTFVKSQLNHSKYELQSVFPLNLSAHSPEFIKTTVHFLNKQNNRVDSVPIYIRIQRFQT